MFWLTSIYVVEAFKEVYLVKFVQLSFFPFFVLQNLCKCWKLGAHTTLPLFELGQKIILDYNM